MASVAPRPDPPLHGLLHRLLDGLLRAEAGAPGPVRRWLAGAPVVVEGRTLDPELQLILRLQRLTGADTFDPDRDVADRRADMRRRRLLIGGDHTIGSTHDRVVAGAAGPVRVRLYVPRGAGPVTPLLLYCHGGGWVEGDLDTHDGLCRVLAQQAGVRVLALDYRLAPDHPWPAAVDDCWVVLRWVVEHAADLGADRDRIAVGGDSAGGNLAAVLAQRAAAARIPLALQLLIYPATDFVDRRPSRHRFDQGFFLSAEYMDFAEASYVPAVPDKHDPAASPLRATSLEGLAPAVVVTAGFDPLRDEGDEYADAMAVAGVPVEHWCEDSLTHGYLSFTGVGRSCPAAIARISAVLRRRLHPPAGC